MNIKIIITLLILVVSFSNSYASFPVKRQVATSLQSIEKNAIDNYELALSPQSTSGKSQLTALLLCIFVGWLGIHRFYLGYIWQGIVQLLTFGVFGIWTLIDLIRIITGDLQPKNGAYGKTL